MISTAINVHFMSPFTVATHRLVITAVKELSPLVKDVNGKARSCTKCYTYSDFGTNITDMIGIVTLLFKQVIFSQVQNTWIQVKISVPFAPTMTDDVKVCKCHQMVILAILNPRENFPIYSTRLFILCFFNCPSLYVFTASARSLGLLSNASSTATFYTCISLPC